MPNTFEYADWLAMTCLDLLENKRAVSQFFNTDYSKEFKLKFPVGDTIRVPFPQQFTVRNGLTYNPQAINRRHATVTVQDPFGIDFDWDSAEEALKAPRGQEKVEKEILAPAMAQLAQEIDSRAALFAYQNAASVVGILGTNPTSFDGSTAAARETMVELACPEGMERAFCCPPAVMRALKNNAITYFNPVADISKQYRTGIIGHADSFEMYESMSLWRHTAGTWAAAVTLGAALTGTGDTSITVTCTTGDTFNAGDKIALANILPVNPATRRTFGLTAKTFTVLTAATGVAGSATLSISPPIYGPGSQYQNVNALPAVGTALTLWPGTTTPNGKTGTIALALHPNAFGMVGIELEEPKASSVELVSQKRDPDSGNAVRFIRQFDGQLSRMINRFDVQIGFGSFYNDACAVAVACG
jgi:hypothetical protein